MKAAVYVIVCVLMNVLMCVPREPQVSAHVPATLLFCEWNEWSDCSAFCGTGEQTRDDGCGHFEARACFQRVCK